MGVRQLSKLCTCGLGLPEGEGNTPVTCDSNGNLVTNVDSINCATLPVSTEACSNQMVCVDGAVRTKRDAYQINSAGNQSAAFGSDVGTPMIVGVPLITPSLCFPEFDNGPCFTGNLAYSFFGNCTYSNSAGGQFVQDPQVSNDGGLTWASMGIFNYITGLESVKTIPFSVSLVANTYAPGATIQSICFRIVWTAILPGSILYEVSLRAERSTFISATNV